MLNPKSFLIFLETCAFFYPTFLAGEAVLNVLKVRMVSCPRVVYGVLAGMGIMGSLGLVLALLGWFSRTVIEVLFFLIVLLSFKTLRKHIHQLKDFLAGPLAARCIRFFQKGGYLQWLIVFWVVMNFFIVFVPITAHDTLNYHLPIIRDLLSKKVITFTPSIPSYDYLPVMGEIIYAMSLSLFGNTSAPFVFQVLQYSFLVLFLLLFYQALRPHLQVHFLIPASLLGMLAIMDFEREVMHGGYVDVLAYLFGFASMFLIIQMVLEKRVDLPRVILSSFLLAIMLSIKYTGLFFLVICGLFLLFALIREKREVNPVRERTRGASAPLSARFSNGVKQAVKLIVIFGVVLFLFAGFWYVKNAVSFGNPFYPMFSDAKSTGAVNYFLVPRTAFNYLFFPFKIFGRWFVFPKESSSRLVVVGYFALLYLLMAFLLFAFRRFRLFELLLFIFIHLYLTFLFFTSHQIRFLLPAVIAVPLLLALLLDKAMLWLKVKTSERTFRAVLKFSLVALAVFFSAAFLGNLHYFKYRWYYEFGVISEQQYIHDIGNQ